MRAPLEALFADLGPLLGLAADGAVMVGESSLADLKTRPDYAVTRANALIGFIEVKAPGKGADPRVFTAEHDKAQWEKLQSLPNLIYTDGNAISLWRDGKLARSIVHLEGDIRSSGAALAAPPELLGLLTDFYQWQPIVPGSPAQLAGMSARLCRLLREEVGEQLTRGAKGLAALREDWRRLLFPHATNEEFADGYAQAVTFGLLMARARGIPLAGGIDAAAKSLRKTNSLIGSALALLTEEAAEEHLLETSLKTLTRVLDEVDWAKISKGDPEAWLYFYELFLKEYDNTLRRLTGSYYTPPEVVMPMVALADEALRSPTRFGLARGLAAPEVTLADPAVGTGTFLLAVLRKIAATIEGDEGAGAVPGRIKEALRRLIGFEIQFGPFAVAQLRLLAEVVDLEHIPAGAATAAELRLYIADTLADPDEETAWIPHSLAGVAESRRAANAVKRKEAITVVIGNPPYKEKAKGWGGWVEDRGPGLNAPLDDWQPPTEWRVGAHAKHLRNLYVYFWRWAAWKVFGGQPFRSGHDQSEAHWTDRRGVVCFITVAGFLNGPGFQKMRADLRRDASEIWVIDCSPEGHQPPVGSRIFQGVQQPVCIVLAARLQACDPKQPARVRFRSLPEGAREVKFAALTAMGLDSAGWTDAPSEWRAPFLPAAAADWASYPALEELFVYTGPGVMPGRTWAISPDRESLVRRWDRLIGEKNSVTKQNLFRPQLRHGKLASRHISKIVGEALGNFPQRAVSIEKDHSACPEPVPYAFRSFDRQWLIADARLLNDPRPVLWKLRSNSQVYMTALVASSPNGGPAATMTALIPDQDHYKGSFGGRVFPLWADAAATKPNFPPALIAELSHIYGREIGAEDLFAYIAALAASPAYIETFRTHLKQPGLRIPITADGELFRDAVAIGREVIWLMTFGERFTEGHPPGPPRVAVNEPTIPAEGALPGSLDAMPHELEYDAAQRRLKIGTGFVANVAPAVWAYEVSGKNVLRQWWSYRRKDRSKPPMGDRRPPSELSSIQPTDWPAEYTTELLNVLRVLTRLVALEPKQTDLLKRVLAAPLVSADMLREAGALRNVESGPP